MKANNHVHMKLCGQEEFGPRVPDLQSTGAVACVYIIYTHVYIYICACVYVYVHMCIYIYTHIHTNIYIYINMYIDVDRWIDR